MTPSDDSRYEELRAFAKGEVEDLARLGAVIELLRQAKTVEERAVEAEIDVDAIWSRVQHRLHRPVETEDPAGDE